MKLDDAKAAELGGGDGLATTPNVMRYVAGVVLRERERMARVFDKHGMGEVAADLRSEALDDHVFKWVGPTVGLDVPPKSYEQRKAEKDAASDEGAHVHEN